MPIIKRQYYQQNHQQGNQHIMSTPARPSMAVGAL